MKWNLLDEILPYVDLLYVDIKHMVAETHRRLTGKSNKIILQNIKNIADKYPRKEMIVRVRVVPSCNDDAENIKKTALFVRNLKTDWKVELLPYHKLGIYKYNALSRSYRLGAIEPPSDAQMRSLEKLVNSCNVQTIS